MKYELLKEDSIMKEGFKLYRLKALKDFGDVKAGDLGGYMDESSELGFECEAWIYNHSHVYNNSRVCNNSRVEASNVYNNSSVDASNVYNNSSVEASNVYNNSSVYKSSVEASNLKHSRVHHSRVFNSRVHHSRVFNSRVLESSVTRDTVSLFSQYHATLTDDFIHYGCERKTPEDWLLWLESDEVFETERNTLEFEKIEKTLRYLIDIHNINKKVTK